MPSPSSRSPYPSCLLSSPTACTNSGCPHPSLASCSAGDSQARAAPPPASLPQAFLPQASPPREFPPRDSFREEEVLSYAAGPWLASAPQRPPSRTAYEHCLDHLLALAHFRQLRVQEQGALQEPRVAAVLGAQLSNLFISVRLGIPYSFGLPFGHNRDAESASANPFYSVTNQHQLEYLSW